MSTNKPTMQWRVANSTELGKAVARVRRQAGLTQQQLANQTRVPRTYLAKMESGLSTEQVKRTFALLRDLGYELLVIPKEDRVDK